MLLKETLNKISRIDTEWKKEAKNRVDNLVKPKGSLGKLEDYYIQVSSIMQKEDPKVNKPCVIVMAADHGVVAEGVATSTKEITLQQSVNMTKGKTGVCALAKQAGADVIVVDVGIDNEVPTNKVINRKIMYGTNNMRFQPAMSYHQAIQSIEVGIEIAKQQINQGYNLIATGEMGIGNTTPSAAIIAVLGGYSPKETTGIGANLPQDKVKHKAQVIEEAIKNNTPNKEDAIDVLAKVGGLEIGAMAGVMLAGAAYKTPVIVDGFISSAAAMIAYELNNHVIDYLIPSHASKEKGAVLASQYLGFSPPLNMDMRLGEGTGGALMFNIIQSAIFMNRHMLSFDEAGFRVK